MLFGLKKEWVRGNCLESRNKFHVFSHKQMRKLNLEQEVVRLQEHPNRKGLWILLRKRHFLGGDEVIGEHAEGKSSVVKSHP